MKDFDNLKIAVAGTGYVGLSMATLLSQNHQVTAVDVIPEKVEKINNRVSPIQDEYIEKFFAEKELNLKATFDGREAYKNADFVIIAAPTNYDPVNNFFDTHHIEDVIDLVLEVNPDAVMVIKSTIPVGYTRSLYVKYAAVLPEDYDFEAHRQLVPMQPGDVLVTYADTTPLEQDFGFKPSTSLREGLRRFAEWYKGYYEC